MSADNWTQCPRCWEEAVKAHQTASESVARSYGKVPIEEFEAARAALTEPSRADFPETFREDYDFYGADSGEIQADYSGSCSRCGLSAELKAAQRFYP